MPESPYGRKAAINQILPEPCYGLGCDPHCLIIITIGNQLIRLHFAGDIMDWFKMLVIQIFQDVDEFNLSFQFCI